MWCQHIQRGGLREWEALTGHSAAAAGGRVYLFGGARADSSLSGDTVCGTPDPIRWIAPSMHKDQYKWIDGQHGLPEPFPELVAPPLPARSHTVTPIGDELWILGGQVWIPACVEITSTLRTVGSLVWAWC